MHSTWVDNDHHTDINQKRYDSAAKKLNGNRIQVISKLAPNMDRNHIQFKYNGQDNSNVHAQYLNQTCVDRFNGVTLRRANTVEDINEKNQRDKNLLKLMQQQLQLAKNNYEEKIKHLLKQNSIDSELSKLKIKLQNNNELIAAKDQQIQLLLNENRKSSPTKQQDINKNSQTLSHMISQKIMDVEAKFTGLMETHHRLSQKIMEIGSKVENVEKGLLSLLACKLAQAHIKINEYMDDTNQKLVNIEIHLASKFKKQPIFNSTIIKNGQIQPSNFQFQSNIDAAMRSIESLKQQVAIFKNKQFRYQNSHIKSLKKDVNQLKSVVNELQRRFQSVHNRLKSSKTSSRRNGSDRKNNSINLSSYFDDYEQVYDEIDSLGEDQFFHPLQESTRKFQKHSIQPTHHQSKPTLHNDSFENFTGDQQQQDSVNQKRLIEALTMGGYKIPVAIEIDLAGYIRKKIDQRYLLDNQKKTISLTTLELNNCKQKGWITW